MAIWWECPTCHMAHPVTVDVCPNCAPSPNGIPHEDFPAGERQVLVVYRFADDSQAFEPRFWASIAADAAAREADGWSIASVSPVTTRHAGTAGNLLLDTGGEYATRGLVVVTYMRSA